MEDADLPKAFGDAIRELRLERGISQEALAAIAKIDRACCGSLKFPTVDHRISPGVEGVGGLG
jgi:predicted transcriptional regulator